MRNLNRAVRALSGLFMGVVFIFIGNSLALSSAGVILKELNVSDISIGIITSCFFIGAIFSSIFTYKFISSYGYVRSYAILTAIFALSALFHNFSDNIYYWAILRFFLGFSYYSIVMIVENLINIKARNKNRSKLIGVYEVIFYGSVVIGIMILALDLEAHMIFLVSASFIVIGSIPINIIKIKEPPLPPKKKFLLPKLLDVVPLALFSAFIGGILINGFFAMASTYVINLGKDITQVSNFMAIAMFGGFLSQLFFAAFSFKFGRKNSMIISSLVALFGVVIMIFSFKYFLVQKVGVFLLGFGTFSLYALSLARANDVLSNKNKRVEVGAALMFVYTFGSLLGPILLGIMMKYFGEVGFVSIYIFALLALITFAYFKDSVPKDDRFEEFQASKPTNVVDQNLSL